MPYVPTEKQCAFCGRTWMAARPKARTCSPKCRASLTATENGTARPIPEPMQGFEFLDDDDFVTTVEAASLLRTTRQTIYARIDEGQLSVRDGGRHGTGYLVKVRVGDVRRLMARQAKEAADTTAKEVRDAA